MQIPELRSFTPQLLRLPGAERAHAAGLDLLRDAFAKAGFRIDRPIEVALIAPGSPATNWGGFEVIDPASGSVLRVMAGLGYSTIRKPMSTWAGLSHKWVTTRSSPEGVAMSAQQRQLQALEVGAYRISMLELSPLGESEVLAQFTEALSATNFLATPAQAAEFVAGVVDALAP